MGNYWTYCPSPNYSNLPFVDWLGYIWHHSLEKIFIIAWIIWNCRNNIISKRRANLAYVLDLAFRTCTHIVQYNKMTNIWSKVMMQISISRKIGRDITNKFGYLLQIIGLNEIWMLQKSSLSYLQQSAMYVDIALRR